MRVSVTEGYGVTKSTYTEGSSQVVLVTALGFTLVLALSSNETGEARTAERVASTRKAGKRIFGQRKWAVRAENDRKTNLEIRGGNSRLSWGEMDAFMESLHPHYSTWLVGKPLSTKHGSLEVNE